MYRILLVADASSIFIIKFVQALKANCNVNVTVYSPFHNRHIQKEYPYDRVYFDEYRSSALGKLRFFGSRLQPYIQRYKFERFLKSQNKEYDIIHFHWLLPAWTIFPKKYKKYSSNVGGSMWGGELEKLRLLQSKSIYRYKLKKLLSSFSFYIGLGESKKFVENETGFSGNFFYGMYGSSIIEEMQNMSISKIEAKKTLNIHPNKIAVMLGYSGKSIHRHVEILNKILSNKQFAAFQKRLHFVVSMTRGATEQYIVEVEETLKKTGCGYTMIKSEYQTDKDVAILRYATDLAFQLSEFDGLSSSIKEILSSGAILICGNWFSNYHILKEDGFIYWEVGSLDSGIEKFYDIMWSYKSYVDVCKANIKIGGGKYSWNECIKPWASAYSNLLKQTI